MVKQIKSARIPSQLLALVTWEASRRAFLADSHSVTVWNRTAERAAPLVQAGAREAGSVAEAAEASDVTVMCYSTTVWAQACSTDQT